jgi:hypothetical protein
LQGPFDIRSGTVIPPHGINGYFHSMIRVLTRKDAQKATYYTRPLRHATRRALPREATGSWVLRRSAATLRRTHHRERSCGLSSAPLTFLNGDNVHPFICPAIEAGVMGKFRLMALRANGKARGRDPHLLGSPLVSTCSGYFMFWIWHGPPRSSV